MKTTLPTVRTRPRGRHTGFPPVRNGRALSHCAAVLIAWLIAVSCVGDSRGDEHRVLRQLEADPASSLAPHGAALDETRSSSYVSSGGPGVIRRYEFAKPFGEIVQFYDTRLAELGWKKTYSSEDVVFFEKRVGERTARLSVGRDRREPGRFTVSISPKN